MQKPILVLLALLSCLIMACGTEIGDTCASNTECSASMPGTICDISIPDGYCTLSGCRPNGCPDNAVCINFDEVSAYCMRSCESDGDCRDGHKCRKDRGDYGYCYLPAQSPK